MTPSATITPLTVEEAKAALAEAEAAELAASAEVSRLQEDHALGLIDRAKLHRAKTALAKRQDETGDAAGAVRAAEKIEARAKAVADAQLELERRAEAQRMNEISVALERGLATALDDFISEMEIVDHRLRAQENAANNGSGARRPRVPSHSRYWAEMMGGAQRLRSWLPSSNELDQASKRWP